MAALLAHREGHVYLGRGLAFALFGSVGAALVPPGRYAPTRDVLMGSFAALLLVVAAAMARRMLIPARNAGHRHSTWTRPSSRSARPSCATVPER